MRVDPQQLAEQRARVLRVVGLVALAAAVAGAGVEEAVGTELELAAVVVRMARVWNDQHLAQRARRGVEAAGVGAELGDLDVPCADS